MSWPVFRTDRAKGGHIRWWHCLLGYLCIVVVVPTLAAATLAIATILLKGTGVTHTSLGPVLQHGEMILEMLTYSYFASWSGILASVPVVVWARATGFFGWGTAMITGAVLALIILPIFYQFPFWGVLGGFAFPSSLLGLSFWITVRLLARRAFREP